MNQTENELRKLKDTIYGCLVEYVNFYKIGFADGKEQEEANWKLATDLTKKHSQIINKKLDSLLALHRQQGEVEARIEENEQILYLLENPVSVNEALVAAIAGADIQKALKVNHGGKTLYIPLKDIDFRPKEFLKQRIASLNKDGGK